MALPPIIVAAVLVVFAAQLFRSDKELYGHDLASQTVDLLARHLETRLRGLQQQAAALTSPAAPFVRLGMPSKAGPLLRVNARQGPANLSLRYETSAGARSATLAARNLLTLSNAGQAQLMVVNSLGEVLVAPRLRALQTQAQGLVERLGLFSRGAAPLGSRAIELPDGRAIAAFARLEGGIAVLQVIPQAAIAAATSPLIRTAAAVSALTLAITVLLGWLLSRQIARPLQAMARRASAIGRGEFEPAPSASPPQHGGEVAALDRSLREMAQALRLREQELAHIQQRLLQSERLSAAGRVIAAISAELAAPLREGQQRVAAAMEELQEFQQVPSWLTELSETLGRASAMLSRVDQLKSTAEDDEDGVMDADLPVTDALAAAESLLAPRGLKALLIASATPLRLFSRPRALQSALLDVLHFAAQEAQKHSELRIELARAGQGLVSIAISYRGRQLSEHEQRDLLSPVAALRAGASLAPALAAVTLSEVGGSLVLSATSEGNRIELLVPDSRTPRVPSPAAPQTLVDGQLRRGIKTIEDISIERIEELAP